MGVIYKPGQGKVCQLDKVRETWYGFNHPAIMTYDLSILDYNILYGVLTKSDMWANMPFIIQPGLALNEDLQTVQISLRSVSL
jgi:hypothetical protein